MYERDETYEAVVKAKSEAILKYVGKRIMEQNVAEFDKIVEEAKDFRMPDALSYKILRTIKEERRKQVYIKRKRLIIRFAKACAVLLFVLTVSGAVLVNTVDAFKYRFENFIAGIHENHIALVPNENNGATNSVTPAERSGYWYPEYVPEGYELTATSEIAGMSIKEMRFTSGEDLFFEFTQMSAAGKGLTMDNEGDSYGEVLINGRYTGYRTVSNDLVVLVWLQDDQIMRIKAQFDVEEAIRVAESLKYKI